MNLLRGQLRLSATAVAGMLVVLGCSSSTDQSAPPAGHPVGRISHTTAVGGRPFGIAISNSGTVYVSQLDSARVSRLSLQGDVLSAVAVGNTPTDVTFSPDGNTGYATDQGDSDVARIVVSNGTAPSRLPIPANTFRVRANAGSLYITGNAATVYVRAQSTGAVITDIPVGQDPNGLAFSPDGQQLFVSNFGSSSISVVSRATNTVTATHTIDGGLQDIAVTPDGSELYIADQVYGVEVIDLVAGNWANPTVIGITIGFGFGAFGLAISPDGERVYASSPAAGAVYVIDPASHTVVDSLVTGGIPRRIAFSASGTLAVVANEMGWVDFIN